MTDKVTLPLSQEASFAIDLNFGESQGKQALDK